MPALNCTSRSLHQLPSKPTFSHQRPKGGDSTKAVSAVAHIRGQVACKPCWQLDTVVQLGFRSHHHFTRAEPCTPPRLTTSGSPCSVAPHLFEGQKSRVGNSPDFQEREGDPFYFPSGKQSSLKSEYLVQKQFLTNTLQVQKIMTKAGSNHSVTAA